MNNENSPPKKQKFADLSRSILNGLVGDYLDKTDNSLAIEMAFYHQNQPLHLDASFTQQLLTPTEGKENKLSNKVVVLIHGLTNLESVWDFKASEEAETLESDNYGLRLQETFGFTPLFLRYNTGLSIRKNGLMLSELLQELVENYPIPIDDLALVGFSMGGLLMRRAQQNAQDTGAPWLSKLSNCFYIGTPHEGSPLEKLGHLTSSIVRSVPRDYINHWADWIDMRSEGIRDLKDGLLDLNSGTSQVENEQNPHAQSIHCGSFIPSAQHHFISGAVSSKQDSIFNRVFGDSLVRQTSATPISAPKTCKTAHFNGIPHILLAHSEVVYLQLSEWFSAYLAETSTVELKYFKTSKKPIKVDLRPDKNTLSNQEIITSTLDLLALAFDKTVGTVEKTQHAIADESFSRLSKIPGVNTASKPIEKMHKEILDVIYFSLKTGGKITRKGVHKWKSRHV